MISHYYIELVFDDIELFWRLLRRVNLLLNVQTSLKENTLYLTLQNTYMLITCMCSNLKWMSHIYEMKSIHMGTNVLEKAKN